MPRSLLSTLVLFVVLAATHAEAQGLGDITLESALNQPLVARIQLTDTEGLTADQISVRIASAQDFDRFSLDRPFFLDSIRLDIESSGNAHHIRVTSRDPVREPYLAFVIDTRWPQGRVLTEYTVLLDPPAFASQSISQQPQPPVSRVSETVAAPSAASAAPEPSAQQSAQQQAQTAEPAITEQPESQQPAVPTSPAPRAADTPGTVLVVDADTLWNIALRVRPDNTISVQQTMLALQRANSDAFIAGNINLVRRGEVLRIPGAAEMRSLAANEAIAEVGRQNQLFATRQSAPAASQPLSPPPASAPAATGPQGELTVVTAEDTSEQAAATAAAASDSAALEREIQGVEDRLAVRYEELDRVDRQIAELNERLSMLQEQIASAQEILQLRDLELAQLQASRAADSGETAAGTTTPPAPTVTMAPEAGIVERVINQILANPLLLALILGLLVALLVLALIRRNRTKQAAIAEGQDDGGADFAAREEDRVAFAAAGLTTGAAADSRNERDMGDDRAAAFDVSWDDGDSGNERSANMADTEIEELHREQTAELLAEVDTLIAHGEHDDARGMLQDAVVADPGDARLRVKLMEVLVAEGDDTGFHIQESELDRLPQDESIREQVEALRARLPEGIETTNETDFEFTENININNELEDIYDIDSGSGSEAEAESQIAPIAASDFEYELDLPSESDIEDDGIGELAAPFKAPEQDSRPQAIDSNSVDSDEDEIDFDFDLDLDLDLGLGADLDSDDDAFQGETDESAGDQLAGTAAESEQEDDDGFSFDLEDPADINDSAQTADSEELHDTDALDDLAFTGSSLTESLEDSGSDEDDEEFQFLSDSDEAGTKLDLARAYIDMDDTEGAREILEEVLQEGTEAQVEQARGLLGRLG